MLLFFNVRKTLLISVRCLLLLSFLGLQSCGDDEDEPKDTTAPEVSFTDLTDGQAVWNTVKIGLDVTEDKALDIVEVYIDGNLISSITAGAAIETSWDSNTVPDGTHTVKVVVTDKAGNRAEKEIAITVKNILVSINIAADQLEGIERGFVFLSDENGKVIASTQYENGKNIVLKSSAFSGDTFFLTEVLVENYDDSDHARLWTFVQMERGKNWVLLDEADDDDSAEPGEAVLNFSNAIKGIPYTLRTSNDVTDFYGGDISSAALKPGKSGKLYATKYTEEGEPIAYNLYSNIIAGTNTVNLSLVNKALTKITGTLPSEATYYNFRIKGYPVADTYNEGHQVYSTGHSGNLFYDAYYPGTAFPSYYSALDYEFENGYYESKNKGLFNLKTFEKDVTINFANNKLTYSASGNFDFLDALYASDNEDFWSVILPVGTNQTVPLIELPAIVSEFNIPAFGLPVRYHIYDMENISNYDDLKSHIRNSTYSVNEFYNEGKDYAEMGYDISSTGGRVKGGRAKKAGYLNLGTRHNLKKKQD